MSTSPPHTHTYLIRPLIIWEHIQIVSGSDHQSLGRESLPSHLNLDTSLLTLCIPGAAGQKMAHYILVDTLLIPLQWSGYKYCTCTQL